MIELADPGTLLRLDKFARHLAALDGPRLDMEIEAIRRRAVDAFVEAGDSDVEAFFRGDALIQQLRGFITKHRGRDTGRGAK